MNADLIYSLIREQAERNSAAYLLMVAKRKRQQFAAQIQGRKQ